MVESELDAVAPGVSSGGQPPVIKKLTIERFRGIKSLVWLPGRGVNIILGGGDTGKTTILDAICLLLSPTNAAALAESDYLDRDVSGGFLIQAVFALPPEVGVNRQVRPAWPWSWDGTRAVVPNIDGEAPAEVPVHVLQARGTEELELVYEILQPDGSATALSTGLRRAIGLVRLSGEERNDRDLRLVQGSALDRLLTDKTLRSRLSSNLAGIDVSAVLQEEAKKALGALNASFEQKALPHGLDLALTGAQGASIAALVGLTATVRSIQLPLASWGSGTRRLACLALAEQSQAKPSVVVVDEVERGLEPYRQRALMTDLQADVAQAFITTHSPPILAAAEKSSVWYLDGAGTIGALDASKAAQHRENDPETFLSRLAVVAEGITEVGLLEVLLEKALGYRPSQFGIHLTNGGGHETALGLLQALANAGLQFGGFADDENGKHPVAWKRIAEKLGPLLFRWKSGCLERNLIDAIPQEELHRLVVDPRDEMTGERLGSLRRRLGEAGKDKDLAAICGAAGESFRTLLVEAATGSIPDDKRDATSEEKKVYKSDGQRWFKTRDGGRELAEKMLALGAWPTLKIQLMPFFNAVRRSAGLQDVEDLPQ